MAAASVDKKAACHFISDSIFNDPKITKKSHLLCKNNNQELCPIIYAHCVAAGLKLKAGDLIVIREWIEDADSFAGIFFFDGKTVIPSRLCDANDLSTIPDIFTIPTYSKTYWDNLIPDFPVQTQDSHAFETTKFKIDKEFQFIHRDPPKSYLFRGKALRVDSKIQWDIVLSIGPNIPDKLINEEMTFKDRSRFMRRNTNLLADSIRQAVNELKEKSNIELPDQKILQVVEDICVDMRAARNNPSEAQFLQYKQVFQSFIDSLQKAKIKQTALLEAINQFTTTGRASPYLDSLRQYQDIEEIAKKHGIDKEHVIVISYYGKP